MRPIDADALNDTVEKSIAKFGEVFSEDLITGLKVCVYIAMQQPIIEQPEIIRCQDCKYGEFPAHNVRCSEFYGAGCYNGFCAWGEKK